MSLDAFINFLTSSLLNFAQNVHIRVTHQHYGKTHIYAFAIQSIKNRLAT